MNTHGRRRPLVAGNWKMYTTPREARMLAGQILSGIDAEDLARVDVVLCPPAVCLSGVHEVVAGRCALGAQNMHWDEEGAFTGEISAPMLADFCRYVIVGHSDRRQNFGETDERVNRKIRAAVTHGLTPILCVGETLEQRKAGQTHDWIGMQLRGALHDRRLEELSAVMVSYEPVWAIGTGVPASGRDANAVAALIRQVLREIGGEASSAVRVLYGGSVTTKNVAQFLNEPEIDGVLVGGSSLKPAEFAGIVHRAAVAKLVAV
jgi:triosephosphate isomerase